MKRTLCLALCLILALSLLTACVGEKNYETVDVVNSMKYSVKKNKDTTEQDLEKCYYDDNNYYYFFNLGEVKGFPFQSDREVPFKEYSGIDYTYTIKKTKTTIKSVEEACSNAVSNTVSFTNTASASESLSIKVSESVEASVDFVKAQMSAEMSTNMELGYAKTTGKSNEESRTDSYKEVVSYSETEEEAVELKFTSKSKLGYYRFVLTGVVQVYAAVIYSKADNTFTVDILTEVTHRLYTIEYAEDLGAKYDITDMLEFDSSVLETLLTDHIPTERLSEDISQELSSQQEGDTEHFAGGYGTQDKPYLVKTLDQFSNIRLYPDATYSIVNDIDGDKHSLQTIPNFNGELKGGNHAIYNFTINVEQQGDEINVGVFETNSGTIQDLTIGSNTTNGAVTIEFKCTESTTKESKLNVGGVVGKNNGTISGCKFVNGSIKGTFADVNNDKAMYMYIGGIVGYNDKNATLQNCTVESSELDAEATTIQNSGDDNWGFAGGICGENSGKITNCASRGNTIKLTVRGDGKVGNKAYPHGYIGGIIGSQCGMYEDCVVAGEKLQLYVSRGTYTQPTEGNGSKCGREETNT